MKVLVAGSSGLIGSALCARLVEEGHEVVRLVRREVHREDEVRWDPEAGLLEADELVGVEAVVHLGGRSIAAGRWTAKIKDELMWSRVRTSELLAARLAELSKPPKVLLCASAIGIYGNRGAEELHEESGPGAGFLADLGQAWEGASVAASAVGIRVVHARFGIVLSRRGGALAKMLLPFRLGIGGKIGDGRQYFSWISLADALSALSHALGNDALQGAVNFTAPYPVTNAELTKTLGRVLHRPTILPLPAFAAKLVIGELAEEGLLASQRVLPKRLMDSGFAFEYPYLEAALRHALRD
ncbi:MAG TPA: TIGR01777 family protein [Candidatus Latescibacteria bacterium]|nr:TIGR01777 family protein [Candidatus Handelsmanbacteria bacterium]HIL08176.1 TIGR01777 family protein [Candidatus Latescibacterota bacterium]